MERKKMQSQYQETANNQQFIMTMHQKMVAIEEEIKSGAGIHVVVNMNSLKFQP